MYVCIRSLETQQNTICISASADHTIQQYIEITLHKYAHWFQIFVSQQT